MNNKILLIILVALAALYGLTQMTSKKEARSFKTNLVSIDTASVTKVIFQTKASPEEILIQKSNGAWNITKASLTVPCTKESMTALLNEVVDLKSIRPAATKEEKWADFGVDEKSGSPIKFYAGDELLADFIVGRFQMDQRRQSIESYIRLPEDPIVYGTQSYLPITMQQGFDAFRDKNLCKIDPIQVNQINLNENENSYTLKLEDGEWKNETVTKDSTEVAAWIEKITKLKGAEFQNDINQLENATPIKTINLKGQNSAAINLYLNPAEGKPFVIHSSLNQTAYFQSDSTGIYKTLFVDLKDFF